MISPRSFQNGKEPPAAGQGGSRYHILSKLGSGGMGDVFLAEDTMLQRRVALKTIRADLCGHEEVRKRIERECLLHARIGTHPHIVALYDRFDQDGRISLVMEYIRGGSLQHILDNAAAQGVSMPWREGVRIAIQVLEALTKVHAEGIVHRDIKPSNILVARDGQGVPNAKLMDFGIARTRDDSGDATALTNQGGSPGTPLYMAPEQIDTASFGTVTEATDLYALGVMLYQCVSGNPPFTGTLTEIYNGHLNRQPPHLDVGSPPDLDRILNRAMAKRPRDRFASARAFRKELLRLLDTASGAEAVENRPEMASPPQFDPKLDSIETQPLPRAARNTPRKTGPRRFRPKRSGVSRLLAAWGVLIILIGIAVWVGRQTTSELIPEQVADSSAAPVEPLPAVVTPSPEITTSAPLKPDTAPVPNDQPVPADTPLPPRKPDTQAPPAPAAEAPKVTSADIPAVSSPPAVVETPPSSEARVSESPISPPEPPPAIAASTPPVIDVPAPAATQPAPVQSEMPPVETLPVPEPLPSTTPVSPDLKNVTPPTAVNDIPLPVQEALPVESVASPPQKTELAPLPEPVEIEPDDTPVTGPAPPTALAEVETPLDERLPDTSVALPVPDLPEIPAIELEEIDTSVTQAPMIPETPVVAPLATLWLERLQAQGTRDSLSLDSGTAYQSGDRVWLFCTPELPSYAYLFVKGSIGHTQMLFPGVGGTRNYLPPYRKATLPHPDSPFEFDVRPGAEELILILSPEPLAGLDAAAANSVRAFQQSSLVYILIPEELQALDNVLAGCHKADLVDMSPTPMQDLAPVSAPEPSTAVSHPSSMLQAPDNPALPVVVRISLNHGG